MRSLSRVLCILLFCAPAFAMGPKSDLPNFKEVVPGGIYRGGHPDQAGLAQLAELKINTIIDLENSLDAGLARETTIEEEAVEAKKLGIRKFISMPLSGFTTPPDAVIQFVENTLQDPTAQPIYVHCRHGNDRTGLVIGLYRVFAQHWTAQEAYQEMVQDGFHKALLALYLYFKQETDYND